MQLASQAPPLALLRSEDLAAHTAPLPLEIDEFRDVVDADHHITRSMNRQRRNDDVEIVTGERPASPVKVTKRAACTRGYVPERLQDRFDAVVAVFDQACQERDIVAAY